VVEKMKIMLDAGHGYNTSGKRSPDGMREYEFNRAAAAYAKAFLEEYQNVTVYFAHSDQTDIPLQTRTNSANSLNVDIYVSIHANAFGTGWNDAGGIETYVLSTKYPVAYGLAQKVQRQLILETGLKDRGVKTADFHVLRETKMDAILIECGFMTNPEEIKLLRSETYRRTVADAIVKAIAQQFGLVKKPTAQTPAPAPAPTPTPAPSRPSQPSTGLYKVQVGAFKNREGAEELAARLTKAGFNEFVYSEGGLHKVQAGAFSDRSNADELVTRLKSSGFDAFVDHN
jgi:N-acetylmuramoyl-L-alanine amidase